MSRKRFLERILRCRNGVAVYDYLCAHVPSPVDYDDILRSQITNCVSAFDTLLHEIIHDLMVDSFLGKRKRTKKFENFALPVSVALEIAGDETMGQEIFSRHVRRRLKKESYQDPEKVADGLALVWDGEHKWQRVAKMMNNESAVVVTKLKLIAIRRNAIVHESGAPG